MLQALRLVMDFVPFHSKDFVKEPFHQMMPKSQPIRNLPTLRRQRDSALAVDARKMVPPQAPQGQRHRRRCNIEPARNGRCDSNALFGLRLRNGLQVVLFRDGQLHIITGAQRLPAVANFPPDLHERPILARLTSAVPISELTRAASILLTVVYFYQEA